MKYLQKVPHVNKQVEDYLTEGTLVEDYVLDNIGRLMSCIRECNVTLRWIMLHIAPGTADRMSLSLPTSGVRGGGEH